MLMAANASDKGLPSPVAKALEKAAKRARKVAERNAAEMQAMNNTADGGDGHDPQQGQRPVVIDNTLYNIYIYKLLS